MKSKYLECNEDGHYQCNLFTVHKGANNGDYLVLIRNANGNYDISEFVTNKESLAYDIFDKWCDNAKFFKFSNVKGRYIVIMLYKHNDRYQVNDCSII